jgi:hypothetical protein
LRCRVGSERGGRRPHLSTQWETVLYRFHTGKQQLIATDYHAGELKGLDGLQAFGPGLAQPFGHHGSRALEYQVGTEKVRRLVGHTPAKPISKEADGGAGRHGDYQGRYQNALLARVPITDQ